jgi:hypothetical protein
VIVFWQLLAQAMFFDHFVAPIVGTVIAELVVVVALKEIVQAVAIAVVLGICHCSHAWQVQLLWPLARRYCAPLVWLTFLGLAAYYPGRD